MARTLSDGYVECLEMADILSSEGRLISNGISFFARIMIHVKGNAPFPAIDLHSEFGRDSMQIMSEARNCSGFRLRLGQD
jgi:hypothetical protein